ncbi:hypothetical protein Tco_0808820 [Tanacetum coccineum]
MKDLGEATYILRIKITSDRSKKRLIALSQSAYFDKILKKFKMENSKRGSVPMQEKPDYRKSQGTKTPSELKRMQRFPYALAIGSIMNVTGRVVSKALLLSTEAEYIDAVKASMEAIWMGKFIDGLRDVMPTNKRPMEMLCDNAPAITIANDPIIIKGARHYQRKYHYAREVIQAGEIVMKKVHTDDSLADPFTKPMPYNKHFEHAMGIGVCLASSLM